MKKERLDKILVDLGYFDNKSKASSAVLAGNVKINGETITKAGFQIDSTKKLDIEVKTMPYVSRGGFKLEKALKTFDVKTQDRICIDAGASTGGFTDCLLQNGVKKVYAVDVGYGQLAWKIRSDNRVKVIERTNIKNCEFSQIYDENFSDVMLNSSPPLVSEPERGLQGRVSPAMYQHRISEQSCDPASCFLSEVSSLENSVGVPAETSSRRRTISKDEIADLLVMDLSFISIEKVLPNLKNLLNPEFHEMICLIKPQFEAGKNLVDKGGVVKDKNVHIDVIKKVIEFAESLDYKVLDLTYSSIKGPSGNIEYLIYLATSGNIKEFSAEDTVDEAFKVLNTNQFH